MGLIGTAIGAAGSIFGGIMASKAARKAKRNLEDQIAKNEAWYNRRYNEDPTQRASAMAMLTRVGDDIRNRNQQAAGTQAVMGGTEESLAATKAANSSALASTASNIAVNGEARRDAIESTYQQRDDNLQKQWRDIQTDRANNIAKAVTELNKAAGEMFSNNSLGLDSKAGVTSGAGSLLLS